MDSNQFLMINEKLDMLIRLLSLQAICGKEYREQVLMLSRIGMKNKEIAELTGKTANNIKVTLHSIKKKGAK